MKSPVHAGLIALYDGGAWKGVLIEGRSGSGKSDLALRCLALGFRLAADDRVSLWSSGGRLWGAAPPPLEGLIEARGLGILPELARPSAEIRLVVECLRAGEQPERLPDPCFRTHEGVRLPLVFMRPLEASAPQKLIRALSLLG